jgi:hypothetical protein
MGAWPRPFVKKALGRPGWGARVLQPAWVKTVR